MDTVIVKWHPNQEPDLDHYVVRWYRVEIASLVFLRETVTKDTVDTLTSGEGEPWRITVSSPPTEKAKFWFMVSCEVEVRGGELAIDSMYYTDRTYRFLDWRSYPGWYTVKTVNDSKGIGEVTLSGRGACEIRLFWDIRSDEPVPEGWELVSTVVPVTDPKARFEEYERVLGAREWRGGGVLAAVSAVDMAGNQSPWAIAATGAVEARR